MTGHPQGSNRGVKSFSAMTITNSTGNTATFGVNTTGLTLDGGLKIKAAGGQLTANSTALIAKSAVQVSGKTTGQLSANSTTMIVASQLRVGAKTTYLSSNSTGVKLGAKYITGNSTGN